MILMLGAFISLAAFIFRGRLRRILLMPFSLAVILWACGHLLANGDMAGLILFGGMAVYGIAHFALGIINGTVKKYDIRAGHDVLAVLTGIALMAVMVQLHGHVMGIALFSIEDLAGLGQ